MSTHYTRSKGEGAVTRLIINGLKRKISVGYFLYIVKTFGVGGIKVDAIFERELNGHPAVPCGTDAISDHDPALKCRAIAILSLRDNPGMKSLHKSSGKHRLLSR
jgi:hypothetical protein